MWNPQAGTYVPVGAMVPLDRDAPPPPGEPHPGHNVAEPPQPPGPHQWWDQTEPLDFEDPGEEVESTVGTYRPPAVNLTTLGWLKYMGAPAFPYFEPVPEVPAQDPDERLAGHLPGREHRDPGEMDDPL